MLLDCIHKCFRSHLLICIKRVSYALTATSIVTKGEYISASLTVVSTGTKGDDAPGVDCSIDRDDGRTHPLTLIAALGHRKGIPKTNPILPMLVHCASRWLSSSPTKESAKIKGDNKTNELPTRNLLPWRSENPSSYEKEESPSRHHMIHPASLLPKMGLKKRISPCLARNPWEKVS